MKMRLEKIIKLTKNITLSLPLVFALSCNPSHNEHYYPTSTVPENNNTAQNDSDTTIPPTPTIPLPTPPPATPSPTPTPVPNPQPANNQYLKDISVSSIIDEEYNTSAQVLDLKNNFCEFTRFSLDPSPILPINNVINTIAYNKFYSIGRMVVTVKDDSGIYHAFWLKDVESIERQSNITTVYFKNKQSFQGRWISNDRPIQYYYVNSSANFTGMINEGGIDVPKAIDSRNISVIIPDTSNSQAAFEQARSSIFRGLKAPKRVELVDGTVFSSDLSYIMDCCGHWGFTSLHEMLVHSLAVFEVDESTQIKKYKYISSLEEIAEIELTGKFLQESCPITTFNPSGTYQTQRREVIIRYKNNTTEKVYLYLTSESYGGICESSSLYCEFDMLILHKDNGAIMIPLDKIRKIIPEEIRYTRQETIKNPERFEGMTLTSWMRDDYLSLAAFNTLLRMHANGADTTSILTTWYQKSVNSTIITRNDIKTPSDAGLERMITKTHSLGMRPIIKAHLDIDNNKYWRGDITFSDESDWAKWFQSYNDFILHYAEIAERNSVDMLVIGTELKGTTHRQEWNQIIDNIRLAAPHVKLVYAANHDEYRNICFWNKLDYIGVDAYFKLTDSFNPTQQELEDAWEGIALELEDFSNQNNGKKILLTELGYQSYDGTNTRPYDAPTRVVDTQEQADCFGAALKVLSPKPWYAGSIIWGNYFETYHTLNDPDKYNTRDKLAEDIINDFYEGE